MSQKIASAFLSLIAFCFVTQANAASITWSAQNPTEIDIGVTFQNPFYILLPNAVPVGTTATQTVDITATLSLGAGCPCAGEFS